MESLKITIAQPEDAPQVSACIDRAYGGYIWRIGKRPSPMLENYAMLIAHSIVFCGWLSGAIVGLLVLKEAEEYLLLDNVALLPEFQGKGFGRHLIAFAEQYAAAHGYDEIRLYTHVKMTGNIEMYHKLGYQEYTRVEEYGYERVYFKKQLAI